MTAVLEILILINIVEDTTFLFLEKCLILLNLSLFLKQEMAGHFYRETTNENNQFQKQKQGYLIRIHDLIL